MVTQPMEYDPWPSKTGVQVVPAFSVFHTPPEPTATYQVCRLRGWMAMSLMRPDMMAGPMLRKASPARSSAVSRGAGAALAAGLASGFELVGAWARAARTAGSATQNTMAATVAFFMETSSVRLGESRLVTACDYREFGDTIPISQLSNRRIGIVSPI